MPWLRLCVQVNTELADLLTATMEEYGAMSVSIENAETGNEIFEPPLTDTPLWTSNRVCGLFPASVDKDQLMMQLRTSAGLASSTPIQIERLADQDWERVWMDRFMPLQFGERLWVCPSWTPPPDAGAVNIILDPGLAFGSGHHASTALCLNWLAGHEADLQEKTVIDFGCGSGILAIAALKLGAASAAGIDHDPRAIQVSTENARRNGVTGQFRAFDNVALPAELAADVVLANILANPLIELAPVLTRLVKPGGYLVLAGILAPQAESVLARYRDHFSLVPTRDDRWVLLAGRKRLAID